MTIASRFGATPRLLVLRAANRDAAPHRPLFAASVRSIGRPNRDTAFAARVADKALFRSSSPPSASADAPGTPPTPLAHERPPPLDDNDPMLQLKQKHAVPRHDGERETAALPRGTTRRDDARRRREEHTTNERARPTEGR